MQRCVWVRVPSGAPARRKRHIACDELFHFIAKLIARSFCCSSLPNRTRCCWAPVWGCRCAAVLSALENIDFNCPFQKERHDFWSCLSFWVPRAVGPLHPPWIRMHGGNEFRLRQGFRLWRKRLYAAKAALARRPVKWDRLPPYGRGVPLAGAPLGARLGGGGIPPALGRSPARIPLSAALGAVFLRRFSAGRRPGRKDFGKPCLILSKKL